MVTDEERAHQCGDQAGEEAADAGCRKTLERGPESRGEEDGEAEWDGKADGGVDFVCEAEEMSWDHVEGHAQRRKSSQGEGPRES